MAEDVNVFREFNQKTTEKQQLEATIEQLRITLATVIYLDPESEDASPPDAIAHLRKYPTPTAMGGMEWRRWKAAIDAAFPIPSQSNDKKEEK